MKLDKSKWSKVKFGEVCTLVSENTKDAKSDGFEYLIGLEHIEPNNLHLRSWNTADMETTFTRIFRKGHVLFGRRRAYQRKVAYAKFDGICSGDIMVFQADTEILLPELLPFIVQSDGFFHCAVDTSAGSLSPRTKFNDLANYEFLLPPKEEQSRLAELLWAADDVVEREKEVKERLEKLIRSYQCNLFGMCLNGKYVHKEDKVIIIKDIVMNINTCIGKLDTLHYNNNGKYPIIDQSNKYIAGYSNDETLVYNGNLPVLIFGDHTTIIKYVDFPFIMGADGTKVLSCTKEIVPKYLYYAIQNLNLIPQGYRRHYAILKEQVIPLKKVSEQEIIVSHLDELEKNIMHCENQIIKSWQLKSSLINQIF
jgi:type I restriction enzyme S subunit